MKKLKEKKERRIEQRRKEDVALVSQVVCTVLSQAIQENIISVGQGIMLKTRFEKSINL